jgi:hypothetical protein
MSEDHVNPPEVTEDEIEKVLLIQRGNVGCEKLCNCRVRFALSLTDTQNAALTEYVRRFEAGEVASGEMELKEILPDLSPKQVYELDRIFRDRGGASREDITGGRNDAIEAIRRAKDFEYMLYSMTGNKPIRWPLFS